MKNIVLSAIAFVFSSLLASNSIMANDLSLPTVKVDTGITIVKLRASTPVYFETVKDINTETVQVGNLIQLKVRSKVVVRGKTVISANTMALGRITEVSRTTANSSGSATLEVRDVQAVDGQLINLNATYQLSGDCTPGQPCLIRSGFIITAHTMDTEEIEVEL